MPVRMMTVISKHCPALIPDRPLACQTIRVHPRLKSASSDIRPRLDDVDLPLHISPLNILVATAEHALDLVRRAHEPPNDIVSQHHPIAFDRHLFNATLLIKRQQTILSGARQNLYRIAARAEKYLLGNTLTLDDLDTQTTLGADVNHTFVFSVEWIGADHHA